MPVRITFSSILPATIPADGWKVGYRIKGSVGAYTTPVGSPFMAQPIIFDTPDAPGTLYEGFIKADCGAIESTNFNWVTPCACSGGYTPSVDGSVCELIETVAATITNSGYCFAPSTNTNYTLYESRIYAMGFTVSDIILPAGSLGGNIVARMGTGPQWANPTFSTTLGPLNREGVWIDSDCNGSADALAPGVSVTMGFMYNNLGATRTVYLGVGGDNEFKVVVNGALLIDSGATGGVLNFRIWHIIPVTIVPGINYFNVIGKGDGSINDSIGAVLYDNSATEIEAATTDGDLDIIFKSSTLRGTTFDVATCPSGYSLDVSGGSGSYECTRTLTEICNSA